jgi:Na+/phosphate symporter
MGLFDGFEIIAILLAVGVLLVLSARLRIQKNIVMLLLVIGVLFLGLMSLSKLAMNLFGAVLILGLLVALLVVIQVRRHYPFA